MDDVFKLVLDRYREHGNSLSGAQLMSLSSNLVKMREKYTDEELKDMLNKHFHRYHVLSIRDRG